MSYKEIPRDTPIKDIKKLYHNLRQEAKGIEFAINYGGDANTIATNKGIPMKEAQKIYNDYMSGFKGIKKYQDFARKDVMEKGYILLNPLTGHKAYIYDFDELQKIKNKFKEPGFWDYYREMKNTNPSCDTVQEVKKFFKRKSASEKQSINYRRLVCGLLWQHSMKKWKNCWEAKYLCICQSAAEPHGGVRKVQRLRTLR